jgi:hypothetical protein
MKVERQILLKAWRNYREITGIHPELHFWQAMGLKKGPDVWNQYLLTWDIPTEKGVALINALASGHPHTMYKVWKIRYDETDDTGTQE